MFRGRLDICSSWYCLCSIAEYYGVDWIFAPVCNIAEYFVVSNVVKTVYCELLFDDIYRVSKKKHPASERLLLPESISNDTLQYLIE